jgi:amino acid adenylation domain-containing protein
LPDDAVSVGRETLATRLSGWAAQRPDDVALFDAARRVTWRELDARATAIARRILAAPREAQGPGRVLLLFRDRIGTIEALAGVVRSGHTFVVLDANDPDERVRFVAADAEASLLLTEASLADRAAAIAPRGCAVVDVGDAAMASRGAHALPDVDPRGLAYIAYTSGSTGRAKGVCQTHVAQLHFADLYVRVAGLAPGDRMALLHSIAFGAGLATVARTLARGLTLGLYDLRQQGVAGLADWLDRERIGAMHLFPTILRELDQQLGPRRALPHLRLVQLGGETAFAEDMARVRRHTGPSCRFLHQLAATEVSLVAQYLPSRDVELPPGAVIPVGSPVDGVRVEIRRDDGSAAAIDEAGEIVAFSRYVTPGYWKRPELDAQVFVADPDDPEGRGYRMGDIGRIDAQGLLHFIGRAGTRVKIRGHTVDLAEVDAALLAWPDAAIAAIAAEADPEDALQMRLVAYVEARAGARRDARALLAFVGERLPRHMMPSAVRFLAALPRTANGKVDRKRLADEPVLAPEAPRYVAPRDATEAAVAHMFAELLKLERAGRDDDFFLLGGDSMMAGELQLRIHEAFGVRLAGFQDEATVGGIAAAIKATLADAGPRARAMPMLVPMWRNGSHVPLFMVHGRQGQAFVSPYFMNVLGDDQPVWTFQARGLDGRSAPHPTVEAMIDDYAAEIRKVRPQGPYFIGGLCVGCYVAAGIARKLRSEGDDVLPLLLLDPPNRVRARTAAHGDPDHVRAKMRKRRGEGRLSAEMDDPEYMEISVQTAAAFNDAIARYVPPPYDGPVYVLSSRNRMRRDDPLEIRRYFTGRVKRYEVGNSHNEALDPRNPVFAATLRRCLDLIRAADRSPGAAAPVRAEAIDEAAPGR